MPVAMPESASTDAMLGLLVDHAAAVPVTVAPLASFIVAVNAAALPTGMLAVAGVTAIDATGPAVTVGPVGAGEP